MAEDGEDGGSGGDNFRRLKPHMEYLRRETGAESLAIITVATDAEGRLYGDGALEVRPAHLQRVLTNLELVTKLVKEEIARLAN